MDADGRRLGKKIRGLEDEKSRRYEMKQIVQNLKNGKTELVEVPAPQVKAGYVLIQTSRSLVSIGTERMLIHRLRRFSQIKK